MVLEDFLLVKVGVTMGIPSPSGPIDPDIERQESELCGRIGGKSFDSIYGLRLHFVHLLQVSEYLKSSGNLPILSKTKVNWFLVKDRYLLKDESTGKSYLSSAKESLDIYINKIRDLGIIR